MAGSYDADDVAAAWNSCMRLSCLKHGATVHTQFDLVPPYPKFEPRIRYVIASAPDPNPDKIHRIHVFFGLPDPDLDPLVRGMDPDPALDPDPDLSIIMQK